MDESPITPPIDYYVAIEDWSPHHREEIAEGVFRWMVTALNYFSRQRWYYDHLGNRWRTVSVIDCPPFVYERHGWRLVLRVPEYIEPGPEGLRQACDKVMALVERVVERLGCVDYCGVIRALQVARGSH
jgi:hypothetical protein